MAARRYFQKGNLMPENVRRPVKDAFFNLARGSGISGQSERETETSAAHVNDGHWKLDIICRVLHQRTQLLCLGTENDNLAITLNQKRF